MPKNDVSFYLHAVIEFLVKQINFAPSTFNVYGDFYVGTSSVWHWVNTTQMEVGPVLISLKMVNQEPPPPPPPYPEMKLSE
jgi:hypothetical protein